MQLMRNTALIPTVQTTRMLFWLALFALASGVFLKITDELLEPSAMDAFDKGALRIVASIRTPWLNGIAVDITALGSITLVSLHTGIALLFLIGVRDRAGATQLLCGSAGAGLLTIATKSFIERARPEVIPQLVDVVGFSYPSGHSLTATAMYATIAAIISRYARAPRALGATAVITVVLIAIVGGSRVYLGVHYPSDVASGTALGLSWACFLAGFFSVLERRRLFSADSGGGQH